MEKPKHHVFVCASFRLTGQQKGFCQGKDAGNIVQMLTEAVEEHGVSDEIMVSATGCLNLCDQGPIVIVYPENVWYGGVTPDDAEEIISAVLDGTVVEHLVIG
ncbi:MAG: (2Fe-2S) ferredoxin domain-containing protein [Methanocorpusculum sp.]|uniref:(2Fe-2S) ferredoxin domain-containing protein n=1 Tax=Methanocorpusculum petauri TaxID=3002863 RepID=A0ABT4IHX5_9EURY|nr:(2Fe-2S) ferredoxin domain-containing protein [Methanocorpusculum petauri]MCZ9312306.1 (2Fe-2S) ferredoxin domain-containing protein [Methanocorpusculum sp.]MCZ0861351.1 (2Fe-2S) ferredoxin domain-containing protein [Methanocorpusculum petauri]MDE2443368.1 (2Fe-2S) ferredoxin domain-containing protein [Methanocorpusculum sp.]MDE2519518.1 (2Fe-2S) ferredoxin domain-containing protein [Methanocorpusculum sp.]MDE2522338.1 (2Fe-2S) ferredoxin domain-containing protein [Methanocorpusculum sp.]